MNKYNVEMKNITKDSLKGALLILLENEKIHDIKVTALVKKAGISRASFYRYYRSVDEVLYDAVDNIINEVTSTLKMNKVTTWNTVVKIFKNNKDHLIKLLKVNQLHLLLERFNNLFDSDNYYMAAWSGLVYNILFLWVKNGMVDEEKEIVKKIKKATIKLAEITLDMRIFN